MSATNSTVTPVDARGLGRLTSQAAEPGKAMHDGYAGQGTLSMEAVSAAFARGDANFAAH